MKPRAREKWLGRSDLKDKLQCELKLACVVGSRRLASGAGGASKRVAELVDCCNIRPIQQVKAVGDEVEFQPFAQRNFLGEAQVDLEEAWAPETIAAQVAIAAGRRSNARHGKGRAVVSQALIRRAKLHTGNERGSRAAARDDRRPRLRCAEVEPRVRAGDDVERPACGHFDNRRKSDTAERVLECSIAALGCSRLKDRAGYPAMPLVVHGIAALEKREAAVLRLEGRLQVGTIVDGVRPGVAREKLEALGEALLHVDSQRVIPRTGVGELCVNAVERNRHTGPYRVLCSVRESLLDLETACKGRAGRALRCELCDAESEGGIRTGRPEKIEKCGRADKLSIERRERARAAEERTKDSGNSARSRDRYAASRGGRQHVRAGRDHGYRVREFQASKVCVQQIVRKQDRIGRIDVNGAIEVQAARVLIARTDFPRTGNFAFDRQVALLRVAVLKLRAERECKGKNRQREAARQVILIREDRSGSQGIEALVLRIVKHIGQSV